MGDKRRDARAIEKLRQQLADQKGENAARLAEWRQARRQVKRLRALLWKIEKMTREGMRNEPEN